MQTSTKIATTGQQLDCKATNLQQTKDLVKSYLGQLGVPFVPDALDKALYSACCEDIIARGWSTQLTTPIQSALRVGVVIACTAYSHLSDRRTQVFIAIYTALLTYLDDVAAQYPEELRSFIRIYCQKGNQPIEVLNALSRVLDEISLYFNPNASNIILTSSLNFINALLMENEMPQILVPKRTTATRFPKYVRALSGIPEAYALFTFPPEISWLNYIQALPDMVIAINYGNDILSFFKEELAGEQNNVISMLAASRNVPKLQIANELKDEALASDKLIFDILSSDKKAQRSYEGFRAGYAAFHTSLSRYKLQELLCC